MSTTAIDRAAWLEERRKGIGSSDAAALVGLGWSDPYRVYLSKTQPVGDGELPDDGPLLRGIELEPLVAAKYSAAMDTELLSWGSVAHPDRPWQRASVDRRRKDTPDVVVELKTTLAFGDGWGAPGTDRVPLDYFVQVQHQLGVIGARLADLAALDVTAWELRVYRVEFDPQVFDWLTAAEGRFWREHVEARVPPGPEWVRQFAEHPPVLPVREKRVALPAEADELLARREQVRGVLDDAEAEVKRLNDRLHQLMGDGHKGETPGGWRVTRSHVVTAGGTFTRKPSESFRLTVTPPK